jgi:hypothetical protein
VEKHAAEAQYHCTIDEQIRIPHCEETSGQTEQQKRRDYHDQALMKVKRRYVGYYWVLKSQHNDLERIYRWENAPEVGGEVLGRDMEVCPEITVEEIIGNEADKHSHRNEHVIRYETHSSPSQQKYRVYRQQ